VAQHVRVNRKPDAYGFRRLRRPLCDRRQLDLPGVLPQRGMLL
jgi:hypothetical protein